MSVSYVSGAGSVAKAGGVDPAAIAEATAFNNGLVERLAELASTIRTSPCEYVLPHTPQVAGARGYNYDEWARAAYCPDDDLAGGSYEGHYFKEVRISYERTVAQREISDHLEWLSEQGVRACMRIRNSVFPNWLLRDRGFYSEEEDGCTSFTVLKVFGYKPDIDGQSSNGGLDCVADVAAKGDRSLPGVAPAEGDLNVVQEDSAKSVGPASYARVGVKCVGLVAAAYCGMHAYRQFKAGDMGKGILLTTASVAGVAASVWM